VNDRRQRIFDLWPSHEYDVLVVGGGITGAGIARDAALRGLRCAVIDKGDFASGTSSKSGKLVHGGARYLKHFHLRLVREACRERSLLLRTVAPHIIRPVRFVLPFYAGGRTPRWLAALGLALYDLLAIPRGIGRFHFLSAREVTQAEPALDKANLVGGLSYWDCAGLDFRLVIDTLKSAEAAGAHLLNYCELQHLQRAQSGFEVGVRDVPTGKKLKLRSRTIVNAAGPWADDVQFRCGAAQRFGMRNSAGVHLMFSRQRLPVNGTLALEVPADGRMIYAVPWGENVLVGTTDTFFDGDLDAPVVMAEAVDYLLAAVNRYLPHAQVAEQDILTRFIGVRPLIGSDRGKSEDQAPRDDKILLQADGMVSITGGKLTTYRAMAEKVVDLLIDSFFRQRTLAPCGTASPISGAAQRLPKDASPRVAALWERYGSNAWRIDELIENSPELGQPIVEGAPFVWGEAVYALHHEYVLRPEDLIERRLGAFVLAPQRALRDAIGPWFESQVNSRTTEESPA